MTRPAPIGKTFRDMVTKYSNLIWAAARLYERHRAKRPRPFNIFTVLRSASDEVNLHSRFLHALLDHVDSLSGQRENLKEFVHGVAEVKEFDVASAHVKRELNHIDLLISNGHEAIVIENKIWAGDQELQLQRYRDTLVEKGYSATSIRLLYLSPDGRKPSKQSVGEIPMKQVRQVSYRYDLPDWLTRCQRRAFDDPGLRESIAQYQRLIFRMTNNGYDTEHMNELRELLRQNDNVVLAHQIAKSLVDVEVALVAAFYGVVDRVFREEVEDLPMLDTKYAYCREEPEIRRCVQGRGRGRFSGLFYRFSDHAWLYVGGSERLWFGVSCSARDDADMYKKLKTALVSVGGRHRTDNSAPWWQWLDEIPAWGGADEPFNVRDANERTLRYLTSTAESQEEVVQSMAREMRDLWRTIKEQGLVSHR